MNEAVYKMLRRVRQDFMRLSDTLQKLEELQKEIVETIQEDAPFGEGIPSSFYFWLPKAQANYQFAIRDILKITLLPDQEMLKHLDMNNNLTDENKKEIMAVLCEGSSLLSKDNTE